MSPWARVRAFRGHCSPAESNELHYHAETEAVFVLSGTGDVYFDSEIQRFEEGDVVLVDEGVNHTFRPDALARPTEVIVLQFSADALHGFDMERASPLRRCGAVGMIFRGEVARKSQPCFEDAVLNSGESETPGSGLRLRADVLRLMADLSEEEAASLARGHSCPPVAEEYRQVIETVLKTIRERHHDSIRLEEIADVAGMRAESFCRFFKRHMGLTFTQYLNEVRLESAAKLLASSGRRVFEIGAQAGYTNLSYFNRRFRQRYGLTPQEFRRKHQTQ